MNNPTLEILQNIWSIQSSKYHRMYILYIYRALNHVLNWSVIVKPQTCENVFTLIVLYDVKRDIDSAHFVIRTRADYDTRAKFEMSKEK